MAIADGIDYLEGSYERDVLVAGGFDQLYGGADDDQLSSRTPSEGVELMDGGLNNDTIFGSEADDKLIFGDVGDDTIRAGGGNDTVDGGGNDDQIFGDAGNDMLFGGLAADFLSGGADNDVCDGDERVRTPPTTVRGEGRHPLTRRVWRGVLAIGVIALAPGSAAQAAEQTYRFEPVDAAICKKRTEMGDKSGGTTKLATNKAHKYNAGDGNDTLIGGNKDDILNGGRGNDRVFGGGGNDVVCGGVDNDEVFGEEGNDRVFGEEDNDFLDGGEGNDKLNGQAGLDRLVGFMKTKGKIVDAGKDLLDGSFEADVLVAGGFDELIGGAENDELCSAHARPGREAHGRLHRQRHDHRLRGRRQAPLRRHRRRRHPRRRGQRHDRRRRLERSGLRRRRRRRPDRRRQRGLRLRRRRRRRLRRRRRAATTPSTGQLRAGVRNSRRAVRRTGGCPREARAAASTSSSRKSGWAIARQLEPSLVHRLAGELGGAVLGDDHVDLMAGRGDHRSAVEPGNDPRAELAVHLTVEGRQSRERSSSSRPEPAAKSSWPPIPEYWRPPIVSATTWPWTSTASAALIEIIRRLAAIRSGELTTSTGRKATSALPSSHS